MCQHTGKLCAQTCERAAHAADTTHPRARANAMYKPLLLLLFQRAHGLKQLGSVIFTHAINALNSALQEAKEGGCERPVEQSFLCPLSIGVAPPTHLHSAPLSGVRAWQLP
jgi:hypothetical protein